MDDEIKSAVKEIIDWYPLISLRKTAMRETMCELALRAKTEADESDYNEPLKHYNEHESDYNELLNHYNERRYRLQ